MAHNKTLDASGTAVAVGQPARPCGTWQRFTWLPIPILLVAIVALWKAGLPTAYESPRLLMVFNFLFSTAASLLVVVLLGRSYLVRGSPGLLLLGCGVAIWGAAGTLVPVLLPHGTNALISGHNSLVWLSAICNLAGALLCLRTWRPPRLAGLTLAIGYAGAVCLVWLVAMLAVEGWMPEFFTQGPGGTPLRTFVLGSAIIMFVLTAATLWRANRSSPSAFIRWYGAALLLVATGLLGIMLESMHGGALSWAGRTAQFLGGAYMLVAGIASVRESGAWSLSLSGALRDARQRYEGLFDLAADGIVSHEVVGPSARGNFVEANPAICRMLGYTAAEMRELTPLDIMAPEDRQAVASDAAAMARDGVLRHEKTLVGKGGRRVPTEIITRQFERDGRPMVMSVIRDTTERKRADEALRDSDFRLQVALKAGELGWHDYTVATGEILWDPNCRAMWGIVPDDPVDINVFWAGIHPDSVAETKEKLEASIDPAGDGRFDCDYLVRPLDGSPYRWVHATGQTIFAGEGADRHPAHVIGTVQDITERKRAEADLATMSALMTEGQEIAHVGSFEYIAATQATVWSAEEFRIYGLDPSGPPPAYEEMLAKSYLPEDAALLHQTFSAAMQAGGVYELEHRILRPDGSIRWVYDRAHPHFDKDGKLIRYVGATLDITDRKQAEDALRAAKSEAERHAAEVAALFDAVPAAIFVAHDPQCSRMSGSRTTQELLGLPATSNVSKSAPPDEQPSSFRAMKDGREIPADQLPVQMAARGQVVRDYEFDLVFENGTIHTLAGDAVPILDGTGQPRGAIGAFIDVTERRRTEEALALKNAQLQALFDYSAASLVLFDAKPPYTVLAHNKYYQQLWGEPFRSQGMVGKNLLDYVSEAEASGVTAVYDEVVRTRQAKNLLNFPYDGMERGRTWWNWHLSPVMQGDKLVALAHMGIDVTNEVKARQEAEQRAREAEEGNRTLDALMEYMPEGITIVSAPDARTVRTSKYADRILTDGWQTSGLSMEDWLARVEHFLADGVTPASTEDLPLVRAVKYGETIEGKELILRRPGGNLMPVLCNAGPIKDRTGAVTGAVAAWRDITEMKRAMEVLQRTVAELERSNKELEQFAYISAHDLQEPLRQVQAYVGLLKDRHTDKLDGKAIQYFDFVREGAVRMSELVAGLLAYSRAGAADKKHEPVPCNAALDAAVANLRIIIDEAQARVTRDDLPTVAAAPTQLTQLFQNLVGNAIKFRRDDVEPQVHVGCRREADHYLFWVKDNGIGIDPQHQGKVFLIFKRLHGPGKYPGTGIGLAICKKIVEQHGGRIWIESKAGEGCTFYFTLPEKGAP